MDIFVDRSNRICFPYYLSILTNPALFPPSRFRFLRSHDRECNENAYPALHYPEIYLLNGGYKAFYESFPELCDPINYRTMVDPAYGQEYKMFRAKTKSWNGDNGRSTVLKRQKSRSRVLL